MGGGHVEGKPMTARDKDPAASPLRVYGAMQRHYRTRAGMSLDQVAARVYCSADLIGKIEKGQRTPGEKLTADLDALPDLRTDGALSTLRDILKDAFKLRAYPGWFHEWPDKEAAATILRTFQLDVAYGLFQTEAYARALLTGRIGIHPDAVDEMVAARMGRQVILDRDNPPEVYAIFDEHVLRRPVGGPKVMHEQLTHLSEMGRRPNIVLQVIPVSVGVHDGLAGAGFDIADIEGAPRVGYQETAVRGQVIEDADDVAILMATWDRLRSEALPRSASLELMEEIAKTWT
jgi:transcriptional regulator with XRE-family HTH domain